MFIKCAWKFVVYNMYRYLQKTNSDITLSTLQTGDIRFTLHGIRHMVTDYKYSKRKPTAATGWATLSN